MFIKITTEINVDKLISLGAAKDGKITQQIDLVKKGLQIPDTFFFTSDIIQDSKVPENIMNSIIRKGSNSEYQIRTETANEMNRSEDEFSESRLGLREHNLEENIVSVCSKERIVGLIQVLPLNSLDRNAISGVGQIIIKNGKKILFVNLLHGLATYLQRAGLCDAVLEYPLEGNDKELTNMIKYKPRNEIYENLSLSIMRHGIRFAKKQGIKLPFNEKKGRLKKEYEYSTEELSIKADMLIDKELFLSVANTKETYYDLESEYEKATLKDLLIFAGFYYLREMVDEHNTTKKFLQKIKKDEKSYTSESTLKMVVDNLLKISDILEDHLASFSVVADETKSFEEIMIIWDLPLDKKIVLEETKADDIKWIKKKEDLDSLDLSSEKIVGINIPVSSNFNNEILYTLEKLKKHPNIKTVKIKYSLLSHPATIIREYGYKVVI
ncbi:MAG: hypothetical protein H8D38_00115 [DPANN group archaeon]|nr:hypothetical protein [DPANN group archaeon]